MECDPVLAASRNLHKRTESEAVSLARGWEETPPHINTLDVREFLQTEAIQHVEMTEAEGEGEGGNEETAEISQNEDEEEEEEVSENWLTVIVLIILIMTDDDLMIHIKYRCSSVCWSLSSSGPSSNDSATRIRRIKHFLGPVSGK